MGQPYRSQVAWDTGLAVGSIRNEMGQREHAIDGSAALPCGADWSEDDKTWCFNVCINDEQTGAGWARPETVS